MRSALGRAAGLGSSKEGVGHWWLERVTAIALVPLTLWFAASLIMLSGGDYVDFIGWLQSPLATLSMVLLLIFLFSHLALGVQVVIEDYVHGGAKFIALLMARFACITLCIAGILATLSIALAG